MAELAVGNHPLLPDDLPRGECICTRLDDGSIRIDQADPRILISEELLDSTIGIPNRYLPLPNVQVDLTGCSPRDGCVGAILKINGVNRTVIYRIAEFVPRIHAYIAEWPD